MKTIKSKIFGGMLFLSVIIAGLSILSVYFINILDSQWNRIQNNNYASLEYASNMGSILDSLEHLISEGKSSGRDVKSLSDAFRAELQKQRANITEPNEKETTEELAGDFEGYIKSASQMDFSHPAHTAALNKLEKNLAVIYTLNLNGIKRNNSDYKETTGSFKTYISLFASLSILITIMFVSGFPSSIIEPIKELTQRIRYISEHNYNQSIIVSGKDELSELSTAFNHMAEKLRQYESGYMDKLQFEQKRLESVVQNIDDGIMLLDENEKIVLVNRTLAEIAGLQEKEVLRRDLTAAAAKNDLLRAMSLRIRSVGSEDETNTAPLKISKGGKQEFYMIEKEDIYSYSLMHEKSAHIGTLLLLRNVTKYEERDKAKTQLLAAASHEFKTPLSSMKITVKLLEDERTGELNAGQKELVHTLKEQCTRLSGVINELLDFSQIESGNIRLKFSPVKPDLVADIGLSTMLIQAQEKDVKIETEIENYLPEIKIDVEKFAFVFINILNNAVRYTPRGGSVKINIYRENNEVVYAITDEGPGISTADKELIFNRYYRAGSSGREGWGLGLAISKEFIQAQGGSIRVESEPGKGSTFYFSIPAGDLPQS